MTKSDLHYRRPSQGHRARSWLTGFPRLLPGLTIAALAAALGYTVNSYLPLLSSLLVAIILGVLIRNLGLLPARAEPGFAFVNRTLLRLGVVLLGLRLSIPQVLELGWGVIVVIITTVATTYAAGLLISRFLGISHAATVLTATGTAICGAAAVAAMSSVVGKSDDDSNPDEAAATAVASVTLFGTAGLLLLPTLATFAALSPTETGVWIGTAVHEVGQVVAGAGIASGHIPDPAAAASLVDTAVVAKLGRVAMLAPLVTIVGALEGRRAKRRAADQLAIAEADDVLADRPVDHTLAKDLAKPPIMPLFVAGFLLMVALRSGFDLPTIVLHSADVTATILLTCAMVAMGAGVRLKQLVTSGAKALLLGAILCLVAGLVSLAGSLLLV